MLGACFKRGIRFPINKKATRRSGGGTPPGTASGDDEIHLLSHTSELFGARDCNEGDERQNDTRNGEVTHVFRYSVEYPTPVQHTAEVKMKP
jgi:hypothetical protein